METKNADINEQGEKNPGVSLTTDKSKAPWDPK